jgi:SAM-dependent methyltransferase
MSLEEIAGYLHLVCCPACSQSLSIENTRLRCSRCSRKYDIFEGIPLLNYSNPDSRPDSSELKAQQSYYDAHPLPPYHVSEDLSSLIDRAHEDRFACLLDEQIPFGTRILDCGCGTGLLANFLSIAHRTVFGVDLSVNGLRMAHAFKQRNALSRIYFLQMNLFAPAFKPGSFDLVLCHNLPDRAGDIDSQIQLLARLIKPHGYLVLGLHHSFGRIWTAPIESASRLSGRLGAIFRTGFRGAASDGSAEDIALVDRESNPKVRVSLSMVVRSMVSNGLQLVKAIPIKRASVSLAAHGIVIERGTIESLPKGRNTDWSVFAGGVGGEGFFVTIARKM